jgi:glucose/arabinose dehydrogenase
LDLPTGGHYTRNIVVDPDGKKSYISVGSVTNVDEQGIDAKDPRRAAILQTNLDGSAMRVFASGLRNAVGLAFEPRSKNLWTVVNERDMLGDQRARWRVLRLAVLLFRPERRPAQKRPASRPRR